MNKQFIESDPYLLSAKEKQKQTPKRCVVFQVSVTSGTSMLYTIKLLMCFLLSFRILICTIASQMLFENFVKTVISDLLTDEIENMPSCLMLTTSVKQNIFLSYN